MNKGVRFAICGVFVVLFSGAQADQPPVEREADKGERVKEILKRHPLKLRRGSGSGDHFVAFCQGFLAALKTADKGIEYIEPVIRTDDPSDPGLQRYKSCWIPGAAIGEDTYDGIHMLGDHKFRLYRLDVDRHKENGLDEIIYAEQDLEKNSNRAWPSGYKQINLERCLFHSLSPVAADVLGPSFRSNNYNALIRYRGKYYVYDLSGYAYGWKPGKALEAGDWLKLNEYKPSSRGQTFRAACSWSNPKFQ